MLTEKINKQISVNWKTTVSLDINSRQQSHAFLPSHCILLRWGKVHYHISADSSQGRKHHRSILQQLMTVPFVHPAYKVSLFSLPSNPDQYSGLVPLTKSSPFLHRTSKNLCSWMLFPFPPPTTSVLQHMATERVIPQASLNSFSSPTRFASNTMNMNVNKLKNNQAHTPGLMLILV